MTTALPPGLSPVTISAASTLRPPSFALLLLLDVLPLGTAVLLVLALLEEEPWLLRFFFVPPPILLAS